MRLIASKRHFLQSALKSVAGAFVLSAGLVVAQEVKVTLTGAEETPPVTTSATASGKITVGKDKSVRGSITTKGLAATAAHIHLAAPGQSGPPVITLAKTGDDVWSVPADARLTDEQYASYQAGNLYINVHSADNKRGEIRGQLKP
jgi:hypothetical protein